jgi:MtN3 and saliva related transmembrane protein
MSADQLGFAAATFTTVAFFPQAIKIWRSRSAADVSLWMYCIFTVGITLWLIYGLFIDAWPIIVANAITLLLSGWILYMKIRW